MGAADRRFQHLVIGDAVDAVHHHIVAQNAAIRIHPEAAPLLIEAAVHNHFPDFCKIFRADPDRKFHCDEDVPFAGQQVKGQPVEHRGRCRDQHLEEPGILGIAIRSFMLVQKLPHAFCKLHRIFPFHNKPPESMISFLYDPAGRFPLSGVHSIRDAPSVRPEKPHFFAISKNFFRKRIPGEGLFCSHGVRDVLL